MNTSIPSLSPSLIAAAQVAGQLDAKDPLRQIRNEFHIPSNAKGEPLAYFCGHSLGLQPRNVSALLLEELADWQHLGVEGHFAGRRPWLSYHEQLTPGLASLAGAMPQEVVAMNSLSVNLHLLLISFYRPTRERHKILIERSAFPSDRYAVTSQIALHGYDPATALIEVAPRIGESIIRIEDISEVLAREGSRIATVLLPGVQYLSGQLFEMQQITALAQAQGCTIGFDLAHAIGNVPLALHDWNIDFATWCSYKYLNSGPGAIGGAFVHQRHAHNFNLPRLTGWWGHDKTTRFAMPDSFKPLPGAEGWQISNPPIFSMTPLIASLALFERAGIAQLREKSLQLTSYLEQLIVEHLATRVSILTPTQKDARGCQLSLQFNVTPVVVETIAEQLVLRGIICDWREPNIMRVASTPLYNTYKEAWMLVKALAEILA